MPFDRCKMAVDFTYESYWIKSETDHITIEIQSWWREPQFPHPTKAELARVPERFRCFLCQETKGRKHFGAFMLEQFVCTSCCTWNDDGRVGGQIRFDERHGYGHLVR